MKQPYRRPVFPRQIIYLMVLFWLGTNGSLLAQTSMRDNCFTSPAPVTHRALCEPYASNSMGCAHESVYSSTNNADYVPSSPMDIKTINLNINIMQRADGSGNFDQSNANHMAFLNSIESSLNHYASNLDVPVVGGVYGLGDHIPDSHLRFNVNGIHFHQDDLGYTNNGSPSGPYCFQNYAVNPERSLNLFFYGNTGGGFGGYGQGFFGECSNYVIMGNFFASYQGSYVDPSTGLPTGNPWITMPLILHEIGHCMGLRHSWVSNGQFPDKPVETSSACSFGSPLSDPNCGNNIMGYSSDKSYFSPQQVGHIHQLITGGWRGKLVTYCEYDPNHTYKINNSGTTTWEFGKVIGGDLIIENNSTLVVKCKLSFSADSRVIIKPGSRLILDGGTLTNNCDAMWRGVEVHGDYTLAQSNANQGVIEIRNGGMIEYANIGISTISRDFNYNVDWTKTGGIVRCFEGTFKDCHWGIQFSPYQNINSANPNQEQDNLSFILNTDFITTQELPNGVNPYAGITMYNVQGIPVKGCTFENQRADIAQVPITSRGSGIHTVNSDYKVMGTYDPNTGILIPNTANSFRNLMHGVSTNGVESYAEVEIKDNDFINNAYGVSLLGTHYALIARNDFRIKGGDNSVPGFNFGFGVYTDGAVGFNIEENTFGSHLNTGFPTQAVHVISSSNYGAAKVYRNTIVNTTYGTQTQGNNRYLKIDCNHFEKGDISSIDIHHASGNLADQGNCNGIPVANTFSGFCDNYLNAQIYRNAVATPFLYNYYGPTISLFCNNLGSDAVYCNGGEEPTCPSTLPFEGETNEEERRARQNFLALEEMAAGSLTFPGIKREDKVFAEKFSAFQSLFEANDGLPGNYFRLDPAAFLSLREMANSSSPLATNAKTVLDFVNHRLPVLSGAEVDAKWNDAQEPDLQFSFEVFPNPTTGSLNVSIDWQDIENITLEVFNVMGQLIDSQPVHQANFEYELGDQVSGIYLIRLRNGEEVLGSRRVMLSR